MNQSSQMQGTYSQEQASESLAVNYHTVNTGSALGIWTKASLMLTIHPPVVPSIASQPSASLCKNVKILTREKAFAHASISAMRFQFSFKLNPVPPFESWHSYRLTCVSWSEPAANIMR